MTRFVTKTLLAIGLPLFITGAVVLAAETGKATDPKKDQMTTCMNMLQDAGVSEEGKKAMREFMQSDKAPQAMANMMEMARRMGNSDLMLGMTKMMEMMGSMGGGGMMGGQGGMMR